MKIWEPKWQNKNLSLQGYLKEIFSSFSKLVYQLKESFDTWNINPVNKVVFSSSKDEWWIQRYVSIRRSCLLRVFFTKY